MQQPRIAAAAALAALCAIAPGFVQAAQRTFVAVSGVDNPQCSTSAPCRTFGAALTAADPQGEIVVLESGGYGRVTIDKSVTITSPDGIYAGISVFGGDNGVDITMPGLVVVLRGLTITGHGGNHGIYLAAPSTLTVDRCIVSNMTGNGIRLLIGFAAVSNTTVQSNGGAGIFAGGQGNAYFDNVATRFNNGAGMHFDITGVAFVTRALVELNQQNGIEIVTDTPLGSFYLTVRDSTLRSNGVYVAATGGAHAYATISNTAANGVGVTADAASAAIASLSGGYISNGTLGASAAGAGTVKLSVAGTTFAGVSTALSQAGTSQVFSRGDNVLIPS